MQEVLMGWIIINIRCFAGGGGVCWEGGNFFATGLSISFQNLSFLLNCTGLDYLNSFIILIRIFS